MKQAAKYYLGLGGVYKGCTRLLISKQRGGWRGATNKGGMGAEDVAWGAQASVGEGHRENRELILCGRMCSVGPAGGLRSISA